MTIVLEAVHALTQRPNHHLMQKGGGLGILPISGGYTLLREIKLEPTEGQEPYSKALNS